MLDKLRKLDAVAMGPPGLDKASASSKLRNLFYMIRPLAEALEGMIEIAELAMPDTFFQTDTRVNATRQALDKLKEALK